MSFLWQVVKSIFLVNIFLLAVLLAAIAYIFFLRYAEPSPDAWNAHATISDLSTFRYEKVKTNGIHLNVVTAGPKTGPLVVLLHGFPETALLTWHHQIGPLAQAGYHVVAPDQRGYNTSDKPEGISAYILQELVADVIGLFDHYNASQAYLCGHDWGAVISWHVAMRHPERLKKLAIMNGPHPGAYLTYLKSHPVQLLKSWYVFFFQLPYLPEAFLSRENYRSVRAMLAESSVHGKTFSQDLFPRYIQAWSEEGELTAIINWYRAAIQINSREASIYETATIRPETLILWGEQDKALELGLVEASLNKCEKGKVIYFADGTHWINRDNADEVNNHLLDFLK